MLGKILRCVRLKCLYANVWQSFGFIAFYMKTRLHISLNHIFIGRKKTKNVARKDTWFVSVWQCFGCFAHYNNTCVRFSFTHIFMGSKRKHTETLLTLSDFLLRKDKTALSTQWCFLECCNLLSEMRLIKEYKYHCLWKCSHQASLCKTWCKWICSITAASEIIVLSDMAMNGNVYMCKDFLFEHRAWATAKCSCNIT